MRTIRKSRIRTAERHLAGIAAGTKLVIGALDPATKIDELTRAGFSAPPKIGQRLLPSKIGPTTRRNAEGWHIVRRTEPMEKVYRQVEWTRKQWNGPDMIEVTNTVDVPYWRYPRTKHLPWSVELSIAATDDGAPVVVSPPLAWDPANPGEMVHRINLLLELFGEAAIFDDALAPVPLPTVTRLNWELLPPGVHPWPAVQQSVATNIDRLPKLRRPVVTNQLKTLARLKPDQVATGRGGFSGYTAFIFEKAGVVILESFEYGNATYVLGEDWKTVSQMSKAEILNENRHQDRIIHVDGWHGRIRAAVRPSGHDGRAAA